MAKVLGDAARKKRWEAEVKDVASRIIQMRTALRSAIEKINCPPPGTAKDWSHVTSQIGMFTYTGLNEKQCNRLVNEFAIFLTKNGRISLCGLTTKNVD